jgi:hypothetical protein
MPTRRNGTRRSRRTLERELRAEQNRSNRARLATMGPATRRSTGLLRYVAANSRAPVGAPSGMVLARQLTSRPGTRRHGSQHTAILNRISERLERQQTARNRRLAESRMANEENNFTNPVEAVPFNVPINLHAVSAGHRDKREQLNQLPVSVPVRSFDALFERVKNEAPETNLYFPWMEHGPELQRRRSRSRSRTRREKRRSRSRSEPRRPRSSSRSRSNRRTRSSSRS